jgi:hypothetical protein
VYGGEEMRYIRKDVKGRSKEDYKKEDYKEIDNE